MQTSERIGRLPALDALRGIAAFTVVLTHLLRVSVSFGDPSPTGLVAAVVYSPLHAVFAGTEAVYLFFLLSGFVLTPLVVDRTRTYRGYVSRRIVRLWLPYVAVLALGLLARTTLVGRPVVVPVGPWHASMWSGDLTVVDLLRHVSMVASFDDKQLVPVTWSLSYEMRVSIVFPLLAFFVLRVRTAVSLTVCGVAGLVAHLADGRGLPHDVAMTVFVTAIFAIGVALAKHVTTVRAWAAGLRPSQLTAVLVVVLLLYTAKWTLRFHGARFVDVAVVVGCALLVVLALGAAPVVAVLSRRIPQFLGRISYSLYLVHTVVLLAAVRLLNGVLPLPVLLLLVLVLVVPVSWLFWWAVERPSIELSRRTGRWFDRTRPWWPRLSYRAPVAETAVTPTASH